jgi:hypothetical protein
MVIRNSNITADENALITELLKTWREKLTRNALRNKYYESKIHVKSIGISLPDSLVKLADVHLGWGAKAVDELAIRSRFDGFVYKTGIDDPLADVLRENNFYNLYGQAVISQLTNSCAFLTVSAGTDGEPDVILNAYAATQAAALWDARKKRISAGLVITEFNGGRNQEDAHERKTALAPTGMILYTDYATIECQKNGRAWEVNVVEHSFGRPLMEALVYNPKLTRPFGTSRISRAAMSIIDRAMRCAARMDITAEFFSAPQKYLLGIDDETLEQVEKKSKWDAYIGNIFAVTNNDDGGTPQYGQLSQMQLTPLTEQMRALAAEFSGETSIPISSLGVIHDNPTSAESIYAAKEDLIMEAENLNKTNGNALKNIAQIALAILGDYSSVEELPDEWKSVTPKFKSPARPSMVSQSDAILKQAQAIPMIAESTVALEELGYSTDQIMRMKSETTGATAAATFADIANRAAQESRPLE